MNKPTLLIDMDDVTGDWTGKIQRLTGVPVNRDSFGQAVWTPEQQELVDHYESQPGFYRDLKPVKNSVKAITYLSRYYNIYIVSTPSWDNPSSFTDKRLWLAEHFGLLLKKRLILTHRKDMIIGDIIIDDRIVNGVENFKGEVIHFGSEKYPDWKTVFYYLLKRVF